MPKARRGTGVFDLVIPGGGDGNNAGNGSNADADFRITRPALEMAVVVAKAAGSADEIDGILVQMPLPKQVDSRRVLEAVAPDKDPDGFHPIKFILAGAANPTDNGEVTGNRGFRGMVGPAGKLSYVYGCGAKTRKTRNQQSLPQPFFRQ